MCVWCECMCMKDTKIAVCLCVCMCRQTMIDCWNLKLRLIWLMLWMTTIWERGRTRKAVCGEKKGPMKINYLFTETGFPIFQFPISSSGHISQLWAWTQPGLPETSFEGNMSVHAPFTRQVSLQWVIRVSRLSLFIFLCMCAHVCVVVFVFNRYLNTHWNCWIVISLFSKGDVAQKQHLVHKTSKTKLKSMWQWEAKCAKEKKNKCQY